MEPIAAFLHYLKFERRYSSHTLEAYRSDLLQFESFLHEEGLDRETALAEADAGLVRAWLMKLMESGITARSVNRKITALKAFYKLSVQNGRLNQNPMLKVVSPKVPKRLPEYVEASKLDQLLDNVEFGDDYDGVLTKLILELFYGTGMRRAELIGLKLSDWEAGTQQLRVTGKRNKQRIVPVFPNLAQLLQQYMSFRVQIKTQSENLLLRSDGSALYPEWVYRLVKKHLNIVSTQKKRSPHVLRHSFATEMLNNGADLNAIKEVLGHANLSATQVYTHNSFEKLRSTYTKAHPRGTRKD